MIWCLTYGGSSRKCLVHALYASMLSRLDVVSLHPVLCTSFKERLHLFDLAILTTAQEVERRKAISKLFGNDPAAKMVDPATLYFFFAASLLFELLTYVLWADRSYFVG